MNIDWNSIEEKYGGSFKDYAPAGKYKVKMGSVANRASSTGTVWIEFKPADDKYAYPKIGHPISFNNDTWRQWHMRCLFELFGATKDQAKKAVENCEGEGSKEAICKMYESAMQRLIKKNPEVEIEVWEEGGYSRADFNSSVRMNKPQVEEEKEDPLGGALEVTSQEIADEDIPF